MSTVKWNDEQQRAIDLKDCNILVSAGAGSGKTAVLTERITSLVEQGDSILDFAICTFTKKATIEMKERIIKRLNEKGLYEQAELAAAASIFTIDAFCKKIVEENFGVCNLPPKFSVLENSRILEEQAMIKTLNELFEDGAFVDFATKISPNDDKKIKELIKSTYDFCSNLPDYDSLLNRQLCAIENRDYHSLKEEFARLNAVKLKSIILEYDAFCDLPYIQTDETEKLESDIEILKGVLELLEQGNINITKQRFKPLKSEMQNYEIIKKLREKPKGLIDDIIKFNDKLSYEPILNDEPEDFKMLVKAIKTFERVFMEVKLNSGALTFNDMTRFAYKILQDETIAKEYRDRYKYVLVDEYQDTSRLQQAIIDRIKRKDNLFMVGDIKQSIYSFRNADPSMFFNVYNSYGKTGENVKIDLFRNYRSKENVLNFVNGVFSVLLNIGKSYYPQNAFLKTEDNFGGESVEIDLVKSDDNESIAKAMQIVKRIEECIERDCSPKDIAVLFNSVKTGTPVILYELLRKKNIAAQVSDSKDNRFMETRIFLNLISIIDNVENDIPLLSVMYSELGGFSLDDIIEIKNGKEGSFYSCAKEYRGDEKIKKRLINFFAMIDEFAKLSLNMTVSELMVAVLSKTGYLRVVESKDNGRAKSAQLYALIKEAENYESMGYYGLSGFLEYESELEEVKERGGDDGFVQSGDAVNIMTIHKSKGLEFPVVILGDMEKRIYGKGENDSVCAFNKDVGIGIDYIDVSRNAKLESPYTELIKMKNKQDLFEEKMRLLYVAMTRPKERLFIVGGVKDEEAELWDDLNELQPRDFDHGWFTYLDALIMGLKNKNGYGKYRINVVEAKQEENEERKTAAIPEYAEEVSLALSAQNDTSVVPVPKKIAATKITKEEKPFVPFRARGKRAENGGAKAGTVTHALLYHLRQGESFDDLIKRMKAGEFFTDEELALANGDMIEKFINSSVYKRILKSERVYREKPFMIELDSSSGYADGLYMVQGIIDCLFEEDGLFVLVDYKTDNIVKDEEEKLKELYKKQLDLYAFAVEQLTGVPVKEKIIMHLKTGKEILV